MLQDVLTGSVTKTQTQLNSSNSSFKYSGLSGPECIAAGTVHLCTSDSTLLMTGKTVAPLSSSLLLLPAPTHEAHSWMQHVNTAGWGKVIKVNYNTSTCKPSPWTPQNDMSLWLSIRACSLQLKLMHCTALCPPPPPPPLYVRRAP